MGFPNERCINKNYFAFKFLYYILFITVRHIQVLPKMIKLINNSKYFPIIY